MAQTSHSKFQPGQIVYLIISNSWIREAKVVKYGAGFYTVKWVEEDRVGRSANATSGGTRVRESRLYESKVCSRKFLSAPATGLRQNKFG